jgi:integrase
MPKVKLTELHRTRLRPGSKIKLPGGEWTPPKDKPFLLWDTKQKGLALLVRPKGHRSFKVIYSFHNRVRWYHIGDASGIYLEQARERANEIMYQVAKGQDPAAEKKAKRGGGTFGELADRYRDEYAKIHNKSWKQADYLVRKHLIPRWAKLQPAHISRDDVKSMKKAITAPVVANQALAAASAIFSWAIKESVGGVTLNPCLLVQRNETKDRERIIHDQELPLFWSAFEQAGMAGKALQLILLLGQRPGEVSHMRAEHVIDGWWELPGEPVQELRWPGTKNKQAHRVWLPHQVQVLLGECNLPDAGKLPAAGKLPTKGLLLPGRGNRPIKSLDDVMRSICKQLGVTDKVTPHDLRRTHGSTITRLGFGRDAMNRIQNHKEGGIATVYDRHAYSTENKNIMEAVASFLVGLAEGRPAAANVVDFRTRA